HVFCPGTGVRDTFPGGFRVSPEHDLLPALGEETSHRLSAQEQPHRLSAAANRSSCGPAAPGLFAMKAYTNTFPSWSWTVPAKELTPSRVPVLPRTRPAPSCAEENSE